MYFSVLRGVSYDFGNYNLHLGHHLRRDRLLPRFLQNGSLAYTLRQAELACARSFAPAQDDTNAIARFFALRAQNDEGVGCYAECPTPSFRAERGI